MSKLISWLYNLKHRIYVKCMKWQYPDWQDDEYHCNDIKFIWGVKSYDDLTSNTANLYTMNDIDVTYCYSTKLYSLGIETAYLFDGGKQAEVQYLEDLLKEFTKFMLDNGYNIDESYGFWMSQPCINYTAESIPELYTMFRIFVEGYKSVYGSEKDDKL